MPEVLLRVAADNASDIGRSPSDEKSSSIAIAHLTEAIANLLATADQIAPFMFAQYPAADEHAFRRAHYAVQSAKGEAQHLLRQLNIRDKP